MIEPIDFYLHVRKMTVTILELLLFKRPFFKGLFSFQNYLAYRHLKKTLKITKKG